MADPGNVRCEAFCRGSGLGRTGGFSCKSLESAGDSLFQVSLFRRSKRQKFQAGPAAINRPHGGDLRHENPGGVLRSGRKMHAKQEAGSEASFGVERAAVFRQVCERTVARDGPALKVDGNLDRQAVGFTPVCFGSGVPRSGLPGSETVLAGLALQGSEREQRKSIVQQTGGLALAHHHAVTFRAEHIGLPLRLSR